MTPVRRFTDIGERMKMERESTLKTPSPESHGRLVGLYDRQTDRRRVDSSSEKILRLQNFQFLFSLPPPFVADAGFKLLVLSFCVFFLPRCVGVTDHSPLLRRPAVD